MKLLDAKTAADAVKLVIFMVVTSLATGVLVVTIGNLSFGATKEYKAVFSDSTGLTTGDDVRIAGVRVGTVEEIEIHDLDQALVTFTVDSDSRLNQGTNATIRYRNLVGQRYIALTQGPGQATPLEEGETIPLERTEPALDLTVLFNGFKPLFAALSPADVNQLSMEIIKVFQGEGGTVESLLQSTASLTTELANRDRIIGELITNLNDVLVTLGERDEELSDLIVQLQRFVTGLKTDRDAILGALRDVSDLAVETAGLVKDVRPGLTKDISELRRLSQVLDDNRAELDRAIQILPIKLQKIGRTATYGSWFNFYLCNFRGTVKIPKLVDGLPVGLPETVNVDYNTNSPRCDLG
jgi:phospholipid/cholesterol/gamma-HCH transport system substrate-binding protein